MTYCANRKLSMVLSQVYIVSLSDSQYETEYPSPDDAIIAYSVGSELLIFLARPSLLLSTSFQGVYCT